MKKKEEVIVRYYPDGRVMMETKGLKGTKCKEITDDVFSKMSAGKGKTEVTKEYYQGGGGSKQTLRQG